MNKSNVLDFLIKKTVEHQTFIIGYDLKPNIFVNINNKKERLAILTWGGLPISDPEYINIICSYFADLVKKYKIEAIVGADSAGINYAAIIAYMVKKPFLYCRKKKKEYGTEDIIEGQFKKGSKVAFVDNFIFSGNTAKTMIKSLEEKGLLVDRIFVIERFADEIKGLSQKIHTISTTEKRLMMLSKLGYIPKDLVPFLLDNALNPLDYYIGSSKYNKYIDELKLIKNAPYIKKPK
jgi:orotate phosphoribosyltransferase